MKILVTGDRDWKSSYAISERLVKFKKGDILIHGSARGADSIAAEYWRYVYGKEHIKSYPAKWEEHGKAAGPIRNRQMLDENPEIELVIAFHNDISQSKGTKDMVLLAIKRGIPVEIIREETYGDR